MRKSDDDESYLGALGEYRIIWKVGGSTMVDGKIDGEVVFKWKGDRVAYRIIAMDRYSEIPKLIDALHIVTKDIPTEAEHVVDVNIWCRLLLRLFGRSIISAFQVMHHQITNIRNVFAKNSLSTRYVVARVRGWSSPSVILLTAYRSKVVGTKWLSAPGKSSFWYDRLGLSLEEAVTLASLLEKICTGKKKGG